MVKVFDTADFLGKFMDNIRVTDVFALCRHRHDQMVAHQPSDQFGVMRRKNRVDGKNLWQCLRQLWNGRHFVLWRCHGKAPKYTKFQAC